MVSGTLNRETDEIENIRRALGPRCVGTFDAMPPHTPRTAVIAASEQARAAEADLIVTVGGGSITDGAKAVQLCLANDIREPDEIDRIRAGRGASPQLKPPAVRQISVPTTIAGGEFSRHGRRHQREDQGQGSAAPSAADAARGDPRSLARRRTRRNGCGCRPAFAPSTIASRASARARPTPMATPRR